MKQLLLLLSFCCLPLTVLQAQQAENSQVAEEVQQAMDNYDYETALLLIRSAEPTTPLLLQKGRALRGLGQNQEALATYREVITQDTTNTRALVEAAGCCRSLTQYTQALNYYRQALTLSPENKYIHIQYINLLLSQQKYREAFEESSLMAEKDSSITVLHLQAQSLEGMKEIPPAIACYQNIQQKYPDDYLSAARLGALYIEASAYDEAIETTEMYRQIDSTNISINRQNAMAYCLKEDYPTAIQRYQSLLQQGDSTFQTCYYIGICYYATDQHYEAHDFLEIARKYVPDDANLLYYLGRSCAKTSWKKEGIEYLEQAIELSTPKDSAMIRLYTGMAEAYRLGGKYHKQIETIQKRYQEYDRQNHLLLYDIAYIYFYFLKDKKNTERYLEAFLKTQPKDKEEKKETPEESHAIVIEGKDLYQSASKWLDDLRNKRKVEEFFQKGQSESTKKQTEAQ